MERSQNTLNILKYALAVALGLILATLTSDSIHYESAYSLAFAVLLLSFLNTVLRPVLLLFSLPFILMTLGFGILVINALLVKTVAFVVPGFHVIGFWPAMWAAFIVSVASVLSNIFLGAGTERKKFHFQYSTTANRQNHSHRGHTRRHRPELDDDVIDI